MAFESVAIVGVGLIGGSFGLALKQAGFRGRILGVSRPQGLEAALERGAIDEGAPLEEAVSAADLVYLSRPISRILSELPQVAQAARSTALVTDAGSTKRAIVERAAPLFRNGAEFLGGHPMAGKAGRGVELADANLFRNRTYVLTPTGEQLSESEQVREFLGWVERIGARPVTVAPGRHDEAVAWTSHLPQLLSTALAAVAGEQPGQSELAHMAGPGLRDMTRLAESPHEIWEDIFSTNRDNLARALDAYILRLEGLRDRLGSPELEREFAAARRFRRGLKPLE